MLHELFAGAFTTFGALLLLAALHCTDAQACENFQVNGEACDDLLSTLQTHRSHAVASSRRHGVVDQLASTGYADNCETLLPLLSTHENDELLHICNEVSSASSCHAAQMLLARRPWSHTAVRAACSQLHGHLNGMTAALLQRRSASVDPVLSYTRLESAIRAKGFEEQKNITDRVSPHGFDCRHLLLWVNQTTGSAEFFLNYSNVSLSMNGTYAEQVTIPAPGTNLTVVNCTKRGVIPLAEQLISKTKSSANNTDFEDTSKFKANSSSMPTINTTNTTEST